MCVCVCNLFLKTVVILLGNMLLNSDFEHLPLLTAIQGCLWNNVVPLLNQMAHNVLSSITTET